MTFFLHQGVVVMSSQITHTQSSTYTHNAYRWHLCLDSCVLLTVYPNGIMQRHPTPLQVITTRARKGGPEEYRAKQKWPRETHCYIRTRALHSFQSFAHWRAAFTVIPLLPKATFTQSISLSSVSLVPALHLLPTLRTNVKMDGRISRKFQGSSIKIES